MMVEYDIFPGKRGFPFLGGQPQKKVELIQPCEVEIGGKRHVGALCNPPARISEPRRNSSGAGCFAPWEEEGWQLAAMS